MNEKICKNIFNIYILIVLILYSIFLNINYLYGDIAIYREYYIFLSNADFGSIFDNFNFIEIQENRIGSREPVYTVLVYFLSKFLNYEIYRVLSSIIYVLLMFFYLKNNKKISNFGILIVFFGSYSMAIMCPAERLRTSLILLMITDYIFFKLKINYFNNLSIKYSNVIISSLTHVQIGSISIFYNNNKLKFNKKI